MISIQLYSCFLKSREAKKVGCSKPSRNRPKSLCKNSWSELDLTNSMNTSVDFAHAQCFNFTLKNSLSTFCLQNGTVTVTTNAASEKATFFFPPINDDVILNSVNKFSSSHTIMKVFFVFFLSFITIMKVMF